MPVYGLEVGTRCALTGRYLIFLSLLPSHLCLLDVDLVLQEGHVPLIVLQPGLCFSHLHTHTHMAYTSADSAMSWQIL